MVWALFELLLPGRFEADVVEGIVDIEDVVVAVKGEAPIMKSIEFRMHLRSQKISWLIDKHRFKHSISVPLHEILSLNDLRKSSRHIRGHVLLELWFGLMLIFWFEIELRTAL